ncbi:hypothetical protein AALA69_03280 [Eggerthellaceae bacterium 24-137]
MIPVPDYEFYSGEYKGAATEAAFGELLPAAASAVGWLIGFNEPQEHHEVPCKRAVCAALDSYATTGTGNVGSLTIGSFSTSTGVRADSRTPDQAARDAAEAELFGTGLLFAGVRR